LHQLDLAAQLAACTGLFITAVVMFLSIRLSIQQNRDTLSLKKALGFTTGQLKREWFLRQIPWCLSGAAAGLLLALGPGKWLCCLVLEQLGATGFSFDIPWFCAGCSLSDTRRCPDRNMVQSVCPPLYHTL
ncbi:FtsX-like permease family protein, partial [Faecalibaculum rodentium]|uniref:FtsX-like permease family protein n=1 Tax=Faecalibaculum rodentium TaxID=1702221 RepID=UPI0025A9611A